MGSSDFINVNGVEINKADINKTYTKGIKHYVELKNGVTIDIWKPVPGSDEKASVKIDKDNKTQLSNLLCGSITGTEGADDIVITNSRFMGSIDLKGGDDKLTVKDSFTRSATGGEGKDTFIFDNTRTLGLVEAENITYKNNSTAHADVKGKKVLFENDSSPGFNKVTAQNVTYKDEFKK